MKKLYFFLAMALLIAHISFAQNFLNGSFEIAIDSCKNNIPHNNVHNIILGLYSFGTSQGVDFRANSCPLPGATATPQARQGTRYLLFGYDGTGGDSLALALTSPLVAGHSYKLSYAHRRQFNFTSPIYEIGYSNDSSKFGKLIVQTHCAVLDPYWEDTSYTFTPTINCRYITLKSILNGEIVYLDNFSITPVTSVKDVSVKQLSCYPNPFEEYTILQADNAVPPFEVVVSDIAGRVHYRKSNINGREVRIYRGELPAGIYFLRLYDKNMDVYQSKLTVQ